MSCNTALALLKQHGACGPALREGKSTSCRRGSLVTRSIIIFRKSRVLADVSWIVVRSAELVVGKRKVKV